tara:strand:- start:153 stop:395 length:243 start_codon:yes stop_codon:yes gene_type:complete
MYKLYLVLILLITFIPKLSKTNKVRLSILVSNKISRLLILALILFALMENYTLGILLLILYFIIDLNKLETVEGFQDYYK